MIKRLSFFICSALVSQPALADNNIQSVIDAFTNCDNSFFYQLKNNAQSFDGITELVNKKDISYIPVNNVSSDDGYTHYFTKPIQYRGLNITGYKNIYIETSFLGQYYYWGFVIDASNEAVMQSLKQLPWQQYNTASYIANPKIYDRQQKDLSWQNDPYAIDGVIPRLFTVEKALHLESVTDTQVNLICSIQGDMDTDLLYAIRPDMKYIDVEIQKEREDKLNKLKQEQQQNNPSMTEQDNINTDQASEGI